MSRPPTEELEVPVTLYDRQAEFCDSDALFRGFVGGRGSGKTWTGAYDLLTRVEPGATYLVTAPTYGDLHDFTIPTFLQVGRTLGLVDEARHLVWTPHPTLYLDCGARVNFRSTEKPEIFRGPSYRGAMIDEGSKTKEDAFLLILGSLRHDGRMGWLTSTFTPKGKGHWTYRVFTGPRAFMVLARTKNNPFLPEEFDDVLREQYTSRFAAQELDAAFLEGEGQYVKAGWVKVVADWPPAVTMALVRYWDKAGTEGAGCHTAGVLIAKDPRGLFYVLDARRDQVSAGRREDWILETAKEDRVTHGYVKTFVEQEPGSGGKESAENTISNLVSNGFDCDVDRPTGDKAVRFQPFCAAAEHFRVLMAQGAWNKWYLDALMALPDSDKWDEADATSGAFNKLAEMHPGGFSIDMPARSIIERIQSGEFKKGY